MHCYYKWKCFIFQLDFVQHFSTNGICLIDFDVHCKINNGNFHLIVIWDCCAIPGILFYFVVVFFLFHLVRSIFGVKNVLSSIPLSLFLILENENEAAPTTFLGRPACHCVHTDERRPRPTESKSTKLTCALIVNKFHHEMVPSVLLCFALLCHAVFCLQSDNNWNGIDGYSQHTATFQCCVKRSCMENTFDCRPVEIWWWWKKKRKNWHAAFTDWIFADSLNWKQWKIIAHYYQTIKIGCQIEMPKNVHCQEI